MTGRNQNPRDSLDHPFSGRGLRCPANQATLLFRRLARKARALSESRTRAARKVELHSAGSSGERGGQRDSVAPALRKGAV